MLKHSLHDDTQTTQHPRGRDIACRVLFVHSTADEKAIRQQRQKQIDRITKGLTALRESVANGRRNTDAASLPKRVAKVFGSATAAAYFSWELVALSKPELQQLAKPAKGCRPPTHRFEFSRDAARLQADEQYDGYNAIVTTVPSTTVPPARGSADTLFTRFKQQADSEQVNSQFKGPLAVRPVFLHSPRRIESRMFLLVISLMTHYLIQRTDRKSLPADATNKERHTTTLLAAFQNYTILIQRTRHGRTISPTRLSARQQEILRRLELPTPAQLLRRLLPRPPD